MRVLIAEDERVERPVIHSLAKEVVESSGGTIAAAIEGDRILFRVSLPLG